MHSGWGQFNILFVSSIWPPFRTSIDSLLFLVGNSFMELHREKYFVFGLATLLVLINIKHEFRVIPQN